MEKNGYGKWDKKALIKEIRSLKKRKKFGLVWESKPEDVVERCKTELPVLQEVKNMAISAKADTPTNIFIEGDNYHALSVLNYTHKGKIDIIYIDPPYNTGAEDWKYNNNYVDENDGYRHSKWLSMMANRLAIAKNLLKKTGFICVAIDHHELFSLGSLMDEIYGEKNRCGIVSVVIKEGGRNLAKLFSVTNEFYLVYAKDIGNAYFNKVAIDSTVKESFDKTDEKGLYKLKKFIRDFDPDATREKKPDRWYPIYVSKNLQHITLEKKQGYHKILPVSSTDREMVWNTLPETFLQRVAEGEIVALSQDKKVHIFQKNRESQVIKTHWVGKKYDAVSHGTKMLKKILGEKIFDYPKSLYAVIDVLKIMGKKDAIVLDFFAGSGTTGHAVSVLNKEDGGSRRFILCTNNENGIAREVCHPRIKAVIKGHEKCPDITGIPSSLKYYKTDFVPSALTDQNKAKLTDKSTEMLCLREGTYDEVKSSERYVIFRNKARYTGIIYRKSAIVAFKKAAAKFGNVRFVVYVFSLTDEDFTDEFLDMQKVSVKPIPEVILRVYRRIFK